MTRCLEPQYDWLPSFRPAFLGLSGFEKQLISRAKLPDISGTMVSVVTAEDLLAMKILAGRPQDMQDARGIVAAQSDQFDWEYCLRVAREFGEALNQDFVVQIQSLRGRDAVSCRRNAPNGSVDCVLRTYQCDLRQSRQD